MVEWRHDGQDLQWNMRDTALLFDDGLTFLRKCATIRGYRGCFLVLEIRNVAAPGEKGQDEWSATAMIFEKGGC